MIKYRIIILLFLLSFNAKASAQTNDTLIYLNHIISTKSTYIGKPFSFLVDSLHWPIKMFDISTYRSGDANKESSILIGFYYTNSPDSIDLSFPRLEVIWEVPNDANSTWNLFRTYLGAWNNIIQVFYSKCIIRDLDILK
jgi:hypothetical protein